MPHESEQGARGLWIATGFVDRVGEQEVQPLAGSSALIAVDGGAPCPSMLIPAGLSGWEVIADVFGDEQVPVAPPSG
ncbi:hypothetical protein RE9431_48990 (plasmid) [Prescottella equi]|uniref:hypothetical protein n=1 Tax=Rhodococcus hoagii TaxID=43767 RepID=UPI00155DD5D1|nr:hypothetical protein [Prescottella equi]BCN66444.1 hypothetical protein RE9431_48990 [Prescottella equi]